ncbi:MAG: endonuclease/exonuclease/phosphatase family protein [Polymorphobacter sp.]|uniref:endonuclease/exonuclease/phosphatase family protein n=1 Tax=Polymorphobacter sp. TaxID=1909290 RepID=UPI003A86B7C8
MSASLIVASYNIHKAVGADGRCVPERILDVLDEIGADVALLQEADTRFGLRTAVLPRAMLAARGWIPAALGEQPAAMGWHGNAVLVRGVARLARASRIALPALEPRGAVMADVEGDFVPGGGLVRLVGAHLDLSGLWRARQARRIIERVARAPGAPPELVMGDFNEWRPGGAAVAALAGRWRELRLAPSFPARLPVGRLDRVFAHHALPIADAGVHVSALARGASDHLPVWVRLGG